MLETLTLTSIPQHAESLRPAVREFVAAYTSRIPLEQRARSWMGFDADFSRELARRGWVGVTLPKQYGGAGLDAFSRFVLIEELLGNSTPVAAHWIADRQSGPLIQKYGTDAQKEFYLPRIVRAEAFFCIGMSEPQSGSDLASVRTRATRTAKGWRLNGQKIWTTNAHRSHYMIALVRTSGAAEDRHKGLSQFIVDLSAPGVTIRQIRDLTGDAHFNEVFFEDVELGEDTLVGTEGSGWGQVTAELAFERSGPERFYSAIALFDLWLAYLREHHSADAWARELAGRIVTHLVTLRAMSVAVTEQLARGESPVLAAALVKDLGTELEQFIPYAISEQLGRHPGHAVPDGLLRALAYVTQICPTYSLRGGTREILRGMIARGLGLR
ncbi:MAG: acyl-CoA dehydrogenase family protein [Betaproteobacteria bacterium]|nr:MAG: acyl-CoA dehydrogenase family protein [Betaproteobacteria bacterium]